MRSLWQWPGQWMGIAIEIAIAVAAIGCAHSRPRARHPPAWVFASTRAPSSGGASAHQGSPRPIPRPRGGLQGRSEASDLVVAALQSSGLKFGTDGTVTSLWEYLRASHRPISPTVSQTGDVLFFQTQVPLAPTWLLDDGCQEPDHVGIVSAVERDGRISFVEARDGRVRRSYADPRRSWLRRDADGRVVNTFLRIKHPSDPPGTPSFAGEMVCAAVRPGD